MATAEILADPILGSLERYLSTSYHPDRDCIDGEIKERNLGEKPHSKLQMFLIGYFLSRRTEWRHDPLPDLRVQVSPTRYRIPDISLVPHDSRDELIQRTPPLLCIEILSREDTMTDTLDRIEDYLAMGVSAVWIVDPWRRRAHSVDADGTLHHRSERLTVPNSPVQVAIADIFAELNESLP